MSEWRPIESAPKGPEILGWSRLNGRMIVSWDWFYAEGGEGYRSGRTAWVDAAGTPLWPEYAPTLWTFLPEHPTGV